MVYTVNLRFLHRNIISPHHTTQITQARSDEATSCEKFYDCRGGHVFNRTYLILMVKMVFIDEIFSFSLNVETQNLQFTDSLLSSYLVNA